MTTSSSTSITTNEVYWSLTELGDDDFGFGVYEDGGRDDIGQPPGFEMEEKWVVLQGCP